MPLKKKSSTPKPADKPPGQRIATQETVTLKLRKDGQGVSSPGSAGGSRSLAAAAPQPAHPQEQLEIFESAIRLFHGRKFREAREKFLEATRGADRGIAHRAELHARMCDRRLQEQVVALHTPEEHYNYAITLINTRELESARQHLYKVLEHEPNADHVYYALALCHGLSGDLQGAYENLKRAIDIQPRNRISARQDADFAVFANQPPLDRLLYPDKKSMY